MANTVARSRQQEEAKVADREVFTTRPTCRLCQQKSLSLVWSFGETPLANEYVAEENLTKSEAVAPLNVYRCQSCGLAQLREVVKPELLFQEYLYVSSTSPTFVKHFKDYAQNLIERYELDADSLVIDIGSNDGVLLKPLQKNGIKVLGVDPAENIAAQANAVGIETIASFLTPELAQQIVEKYGPADVVTANNVFAHTDNIDDFISAVKQLLKDEGVFVFEVQYLLDLITNNLFDIVYHEHVCYYHLHPLQQFFAQQGLTIIDAEQIPVHGGSIRVSVALTKSDRAAKPHPRVQKMLVAEEAARLQTEQPFLDFSTRIQKNRQQLRQLIDQIKNDGKKIVGYGAPAKATTLSYAFGLTAADLDYIVDDSPLKQGRFMPGTHIPIVSAEKFSADQPDYCLLLAWNFAEPIMANNQDFLKAGGKFIIPVPTPRIIS